MVLAQKIAGTIIGLDQFKAFIDVFNDTAKKLNLQDRVHGIIGSMDDLSFEKGEFDLIWSEGAIDTIGFEHGLSYCNGFLKKDGYIAVTCPSWLTNEPHPEIEKFWAEAGSSLDTIDHNVSILKKTGYEPIETFALPASCWTNNYYMPREAADKMLLEKYPGNQVVKEFIENNNYEVELYSKYNQYYGYVFYIGKKI